MTLRVEIKHEHVKEEARRRLSTPIDMDNLGQNKVYVTFTASALPKFGNACYSPIPVTVEARWTLYRPIASLHMGAQNSHRYFCITKFPSPTWKHPQFFIPPVKVILVFTTWTKTTRRTFTIASKLIIEIMKNHIHWGHQNIKPFTATFMRITRRIPRLSIFLHQTKHTPNINPNNLLGC